MVDFSKSPILCLSDSRNMKRACALYISLYVAVCIASDFYVGFRQTHNDFWDTYFVARHMTPGDHQTWFNPQYPIANCLFLKTIMGNFPPEVPAGIANILFGAAILVFSLLLYRKLLSGTAVFIALMALSLYPRFFHYVNLGGGDPASLAFFSFGVLLIFGQLVTSGEKKPPFFWGGVFLGLGALFRYHVLVASVFLVVCLLIAYRQRWKFPALAFIGLWCGYVPQLVVNGITGHGLLQTQFGTMNVFDLMYGLNWYQTGTMHLPSTVPACIGQDPLLFLRKYCAACIRFAPDYLPALAAVFIVKDPVKRKMCLAIFLWTLAYCGFFSATTSGRAILLPLPLSVFCAGLCAQAVGDVFRKKTPITAALTGPVRGAGPENRLSSTPARIPGLLHRQETDKKSRFNMYGRLLSIGCVGALLLACMGKDALFVCYRFTENRECGAVDKYLRGLGCTGVGQIFSTDFTLYFRSMPPYVPCFNGGAPRWGTYLFNEEFPEFPVASLGEFSAACRTRGVRFVLLTDQCGKLSPCLGELYKGITSRGAIVFKREIGRFRIYEIPRPLILKLQ